MRRILLILALILLITACSVRREIVEIPVETIKTEYIHNTKVDSVYVRDSINQWIKGDTVFIYKEHTKYKYLDRADTVVKVDSIPKIIKVESIKEVEVNKLKWYQASLMWLGGVTFILMVIYTIFKFK